MKRGCRVLLVVALAAGCGKKTNEAAVVDAKAPKAPSSCLHAQNAHAYVWREEPLELALDVELDWTCKALADDQLELTDTDMGAKLGDQKVNERYRLGADGALAEWDDPFLAGQPRAHGLFLYSIPRLPNAVGLRYGGVQILSTLPVVVEQPKPPPKSAMRIVATSSEPGNEKGTNRLTALIELDDVPRSAGRGWNVAGTPIKRAFFFEMTGDKQGGTIDGEWLDADRVLDVDEKLVPSEAPVPTLPVRPAKRFMLAEASATKMKRVERVSLSTSEGTLRANAAGAAKLVLPKGTRTRLDAAPSVNVQIDLKR